MARATHHRDYTEVEAEAGAGEWQALRGELVALLDKVESRYGQAEPTPSGLSQRVQQLRQQVEAPPASSRHREALRSVKRAVDRFNVPDLAAQDDVEDDLTLAIAEIRSRQGAAQQRRAGPSPELRDLGALVGGMSQRLERLEGELKSQRSGHQVREVAGQVEQLTQVVELLAGAVGETGQVKRLETQIAVLASMIEESPKVDLNAVNARLDDVSATVAKLADLQAQQMEREIARDKRSQAAARIDPAEALAPAMHSIEESVRNVYDRIDAIERNVALSAGDFERLTSEMAAFTKAMNSQSAQPELMQRIAAMADRLEGIDSANSDVSALKHDIATLQAAVMDGMEPRFQRLENQIEALADKVVPMDTKAVESQLKALMARMDDAGAQLDGLARLYAGDEKPDLESLATMVAERTSEAMTRKAPAPVAMFGPESLKSIEDRIGELIRAKSKGPDYEEIADLVASRASAAMARTAPAGAASQDSIEALEHRMAALLNTAGRETAERLARLEATLAQRGIEDGQPQNAVAPARLMSEPTSGGMPQAENRLDTILASLGATRDDIMPANPAEEAPLVDRGFGAGGAVRQKVAAKAGNAASVPAPSPVTPSAATAETPRFDPSLAERPPRPQSAFATSQPDPFADIPTAQPVVEAPAAASSTSTFVAAARRAQRARQEENTAADSGNSIIGRALARVRSRSPEAETAAQPKPVTAPVPPVAATPVDVPAEPVKRARRKHRDAQEAPIPAAVSDAGAMDEAQPSFLTRHRRPLLLAATLVAVSMLALNLVLQRSAPSANAARASVETTETNAGNPPPSADESSVVPPRVIEMVDPTATGSINPGEPMSFSKATATVAALPPTLSATSRAIELADDVTEPDAPTNGAPEFTGSIGQAPVTPVVPFELPPEAIGPLELRQTAADGDAKAQFEVAAIFTEGQAVSQDYAEAAKWYERAAAQGFVPAQYRLGNLYEVGQGVEKDLEQARLWYQRAAEAGNRMAMHNLAALYAGGQIGDQQFELAAEWFEQAAALGMTDSQFNLGMLHARGLGVEQDFEASYKWFSLAALSGDMDAAQARDDMAKSLSAEAVSRINAEIEAWKAESVDLAANFAPIGTWLETFDPGQAITSRDVIAKVQGALSRLGFDVGTADGVAGPKTAEAIKAFERGVGMSETGVVNPRFLAVLGSQPV